MRIQLKNVFQLRPASKFKGLRFISNDVVSSSPSNKSMLFYYNRLFFASGTLHKLIPAFVYTPHYHNLKEDIQKSIGDAGMVTHVNERPGEGGAFVNITASDVDKVTAAAEKGITRRWLLFNHHSRGFKVLGRPFIDDNPTIFSRTVQITPKLPDLESRELLKKYGPILRSTDGTVRFLYLQDAITANYCAQRIQPPEISANLVRIAFLSRPPIWSRIKSWLAAHTKVVIPAMLAILFGAAYAIFEPVREMAIRTKINGTLASLTKYVEWARKSSQKLIVWKYDRSGQYDDEEIEPLESSAAWNELLRNADSLSTFIDEGEPTFTVLVGPEGSGKKEALNKVLQKQKLVLDIDCSKLQRVSDQGLLRNLAQSLGYWPMLLWTNNLSKAAEFGIKGVTGQTTEITETTDQQAYRMLDTATRALQKLSLRNFSGNSGESEYLESNPGERPVVVLRGFSGTDHMGAVLAEWAGKLTELNIARVVVVTQDASSFDKVLSSALPNRVFRVVRVEDASPEAAKEYILRRFANLATSNEAKLAIDQFSKLSSSFIEPLGGRFIDLQSYGRRLLSGESPEQALANMVHAVALQASQLILTEDQDKWNVEQAWGLINTLAQGATPDSWLIVPGKLSTNPLIASSYSDGALEALESSGLISLHRVGGRVTGVKASRPLVKAAFQELIQDPYISNVMNAWLAKAGQQKLLSEIEKAEKELETLSKLGGERDVQGRQRYVAKQLWRAQSRLERCQADYADATALLKNLEWYNPSQSLTNSPTINNWFGTPKQNITTRS